MECVEAILRIRTLTTNALPVKKYNKNSRLQSSTQLIHEESGIRTFTVHKKGSGWQGMNLGLYIIDIIFNEKKYWDESQIY